MVSGTGACPWDGSLVGQVIYWLFPQSLFHPVPAFLVDNLSFGSKVAQTDVHTHNQTVDIDWGLSWKTWGKDCRSQGKGTTQEGQRSQLTWTLGALRD